MPKSSLRGYLQRGSSTSQGTFGTLTLPEAGFRCLTLELPWKDNQRQVSCIPEGGYEARRVQSPRFGNVYGLKQVHGRSAILIHWGNYAGDALEGFKTHSYGCILLGRKQGSLAGQQAVLFSLATVRAFMKATQGEPFDLIIQGAS